MCQTASRPSKKILLINDMAGYGKVALSVMLPILSTMRYELFNLPTALVSNTLDYGKFHILETTDHMRQTMAVWKELQFEFDALCTGFLVSEEQTRLVRDYCLEHRAKGTPIFVDPIMGDDGALYNGVTPSTVRYMQSICGVADLIMPNLTEATFLAERFQGQQVLTCAEAEALIDALRRHTAGAIVVTSANVAGQMETLVYDPAQDRLSHLPYQEIPVRFPGTGDIFSALLVGSRLAGQPLLESVQQAMDKTAALIRLSQNDPDKYRGIAIDRYLTLLAPRQEDCGADGTAPEGAPL